MPWGSKLVQLEVLRSSRHLFRPRQVKPYLPPSPLHQQLRQVKLYLLLSPHHYKRLYLPNQIPPCQTTGHRVPRLLCNLHLRLLDLRKTRTLFKSTLEMPRWCVNGTSAADKAGVVEPAASRRTHASSTLTGIQTAGDTERGLSRRYSQGARKRTT